MSIAFFNFSGISVTKEISATTRMVLDSTRTVVIWGFSLAVSWQKFTWQSFLMQVCKKYRTKTESFLVNNNHSVRPTTLSNLQFTIIIFIHASRELLSQFSTSGVFADRHTALCLCRAEYIPSCL